MNAKKRTNGMAKAFAGATALAGRKGPFGNILRDDPYTLEIQGLLQRAKSGDEAEARPALLELFYRFHLRLPLQEARLSRALPWTCQASQN